MNKIIVPTGYMGSGSSAITDLLTEFDGFYAPNSSYEYVFLHCPDGLFDLEDKLLIGNNAIRSDEAIYRFECCMKTLFNKKNYWVGSYIHFISPQFIDYVEEFIKSIVDESFDDTFWYFQQEPVTKAMQFKLYFRRFLAKITKGHIITSMPLRYKPMRESFPTQEEFYSASKSFIYKVLSDLGIENSNIILDQLLLPHNLFRANNYFDDKLRVFVVDRDPRDVFLLNKYFWPNQNAEVPYPTEVNRFCKFFKKVRESEDLTESKLIMRIHFEDLIYNYEKTLSAVYSFLATDETSHLRKGNVFKPSVSIKNTQVFNDDKLSDEMRKEVEVISKSLERYLYDFPIKNIDRVDFSELF